MTVIHGLLMLTLLVPPAASLHKAPIAPDQISAAKQVTLTRHLTAEKPTVFVFLRPNSSLEQNFLQDLRAEAGPKVGFRVVYLPTGTEPLARQYEITRTPTVLVYDRRARFVGRSSSAGEIHALIGKASQVMRIDWAEPGDPRHAEMDKILGRSGSVGIMRTMSLRPEWLRQMTQLKRLQNQPTAIDAHTKDLIAAYVSALNKCKY